MRLVWASVALAFLAGCGEAAGSPIGMDQPLVTAGMEMLVVQATRKDDAFPFRQPPPGTHCIVYTVRVRAVDHARHDLRPEQFSAERGVPGDALGRCNAPELEPTWVTDQPRLVQITILEHQPEPAPLVFTPHG